jgi:hypothetical protein
LLASFGGMGVAAAISPHSTIAMPQHSAAELPRLALVVIALVCSDSIDVMPLAALASEAAADQGALWKMRDQLLEHQDKLQVADLVSYADRLGLDVSRSTEELQRHVGANRIARDVEGADLSRVSGSPTFAATMARTTSITCRAQSARRRTAHVPCRLRALLAIMLGPVSPSTRCSRTLAGLR